jgi:hypothetical protein
MISYVVISFIIFGQAMTWQKCYNVILQGLQQGVTAKTKPLNRSAAKRREDWVGQTQTQT